MSWMCMVLFADDSPLDTAAFLRHFSATWPNSRPLGEFEQQDCTASLDIAAFSLVLGRMPAPIPDFKNPPPRPLLQWPEAAQDLPRHRTHWIVTITGEEGQVKAKARLLTQVVHSILATHPQALGVSWGQYANLTSSKLFQESAVSLRQGEDPTHLWVDVQCGRAEGSQGNRANGFTRGLDEFGIMDIEAADAHEPPVELFQRLQGLVEYLVAKGPVIRDGDTVGNDAQERIRVVYGPSQFGNSGQVMRLVYGATSAAPGGGAPAGSPPAAIPPVGGGPFAGGPFGATPLGGPQAGGFPPPGSPPGSWSPPGGPPGGPPTFPPPGSPPGSWGPPAPGAPGPWAPPATYGPPRPTGPTTSVLALFSLILGLLSPFLFCLCFLNIPSSILAIVLGHVALVQIKRSSGALTGRPMALVGLILGYLVLLATIAFWTYVLVFAPTSDSLPPLGRDGDDEEIMLDPYPMTPGATPAPETVPPPVSAPSDSGPDSAPPATPPDAPTANAKRDKSPLAPRSTSPSDAVPGTPPPESPEPDVPTPQVPTPPTSAPPVPGGPPVPGVPPSVGRLPGVPFPFDPTMPPGARPPQFQPPQFQPPSFPRPQRPGSPESELDSATVVASFPGMNWPVKSLAFSASGKRLAVARLDAVLLVFDLESQQQVYAQTQPNPAGPGTALALTPDGNTAIYGGISGKLQAWSLDADEPTPRDLTSHERQVNCIEVSPDGRFIISGGTDKRVIWQQLNQPDKARMVTNLPGSILSVRLGTPPVTALATDGQSVFVIDLKQSTVARTIALEKRHAMAATISRDGKYCATCLGNEIRIWEIESGRRVAELKGKDVQWWLEFTPDSRWLLSGTRGRFDIWDVATGERVGQRNLGTIHYVQTLAVSADSQKVAAVPASAGQTLYVFRLTEPDSAAKGSPSTDTPDGATPPRGDSSADSPEKSQ